MRKHKFADTDQPVHWGVLKQLVPYLMEFRGRVFFALMCLVAAKAASTGLPFVLKYAVDSLNTPNSQGSVLLAVPMALVIGYGVLRLFNVMLGEIRDTLFGRVTERAMRRVGREVFDHLHKLDLSFHLDRQTGGLSRDIERGTSGIGFLMRFMVFNIVPTLLEIVFVVGLLYWNYGISFALILLAAVVAYVTFSVKATHWRTRYVREMNQADSSSNSRAIDSLINYETVKYFNNEAYESARYDEDLAKWELARRKNRLSLFALNGGQAVIIASAMTGMMALAAWHVSQGSMTIGDFVLMNAFTMQIFMPLNFLGFVYREIRGSLANIENMLGLLKKQPAVTDEPNATELRVSQGLIRFENVSFAYQPERPILHALSFTLAPGQKVAVVGASGSGKSTLVKLLFRFYDVTAGSISIDGQDIRSVSQLSLRKHIGIVPQDTVLFNDSIRENIRYGNPNASDSEIEQAIDHAHLRGFIDKLPDGLATLVGERGLKVSGGEKQRIAIARTLLKRPPILVFDEATSSLDSHAEQAIVSAIAQVAKGHTSMVIAHRLSTIVDADNILVMDNGKLVEQGSHQQLLAKQGHYAQLWQRQQGQSKQNPEELSQVG